MYIFGCHFSIQDTAHGPLQVSLYIYIHTINPENTVLATTTHNYTQEHTSHTLYTQDYTLFD